MKIVYEQVCVFICIICIIILLLLLYLIKEEREMSLLDPQNTSIQFVSSVSFFCGERYILPT